MGKNLLFFIVSILPFRGPWCVQENSNHEKQPTLTVLLSGYGALSLWGLVSGSGVVIFVNTMNSSTARENVGDPNGKTVLYRGVRMSPEDAEFLS